jgi:hypothetical protein
VDSLLLRFGFHIAPWLRGAHLPLRRMSGQLAAMLEHVALAIHHVRGTVQG